MKLIGRILLIAVLTYTASLYAPWWIVFVTAALSAYVLPGSTVGCFISGFLGGGVVWMGYAWVRDLETNSILSNKLIPLFELDDPIFLIIAAGVVGGISAGFGAGLGNAFRQLFIKKKKSSIYS